MNFIGFNSSIKQSSAKFIKGLKIGKAAVPTGVVSEMMKASGGFGTMWDD